MRNAPRSALQPARLFVLRHLLLQQLVAAPVARRGTPVASPVLVGAAEDGAEVDDGGLLVQRRLEDVVGVHRVLLDERRLELRRLRPVGDQLLLGRRVLLLGLGLVSGRGAVLRDGVLLGCVVGAGARRAGPLPSRLFGRRVVVVRTPLGRLVLCPARRQRRQRRLGWPGRCRPRRGGAGGPNHALDRHRWLDRRLGLGRGRRLRLLARVRLPLLLELLPLGLAPLLALLLILEPHLLGERALPLLLLLLAPLPHLLLLCLSLGGLLLLLLLRLCESVLGLELRARRRCLGGCCRLRSDRGLRRRRRRPGRPWPLAARRSPPPPRSCSAARGWFVLRASSRAARAQPRRQPCLRR
mmetsp:Transcript_32950/g.103480  ORF Transcript_32950/g.103480 Transcript_32950/m.103480 type:complete len:355 (-) Transcript_32950:713-1777(-)